MDTFEQDFKQAIEKLQEERKLEGKRPYDVHYTGVGTDPQVLIKARIQGSRSGRSVEVYLTAKGCKVAVAEADIEETFKKNELDGLVSCIRRLLETPVTNQ